MKRFFIYPTFLILFIFVAPLLPGTVTPVASQSLPSGSLILNEISPWPSNSEPWIEFLNPTDQPALLDGYSIRFLSGFSFTFPAGSGEIESGNLHMLNISGGNPLNPDGDGCTLSDSNGPVDAVWWGDPPDGTYLPIAAGAPVNTFHEIIFEDTVIFSPDDVLIRYPDSWPPSTRNWVHSSNWTIRGDAQSSPGNPNPSPGPVWMKPANGTHIASDFHLSVAGMHRTGDITFQVASDEGFTNIVIEESVDTDHLFIDDIPAGTYFWRVRADGGSWSRSNQFTRNSFDLDDVIAQLSARPDSLPDNSRTLLASGKSGGDPPGLEFDEFESVSEWHIIGVHHLTQRKDTQLVCLDGCNMNGDEAWNVFHPAATPSSETHGVKYCTRACLAMLAQHSGCTLSQDYISYHLFEGAGAGTRSGRASGHLDDPFKDLGHNVGTEWGDTPILLNWIYNQPAGSSRHITLRIENFDDEDPADMDSPRDFIAGGSPVIWHQRMDGYWHSTLMDGYAYLHSPPDTDFIYIHELDPWVPGQIEWTMMPDDTRMYADMPPPTGAPMRNDPDGILLDDDADGLLNFDETERFNTDPHNDDTDGDGVNDLEDMLGYLFNRDGSYHLRNRDIDGDDQPKELDPDNDSAGDDTMNDGCEDADRDGLLTEAGDAGFTGQEETDCFVASDDFTVANIECYRGSIRISGFGIHSGPLVQASLWEEIRIWGGVPFDSEEYAHSHRWGLTGEGVATAEWMTITASSTGGGSGDAQVIIEIDEDDRYIIRTDVQPSRGSYRIATTGGGVSSYPIYFGLSADPYAGVPADAPPIVWQMIDDWGVISTFEGTVETTEDGGRVMRGSETFSAPGAPNFSASATLTWEIWLDRGWTME